MTHTYDSSDRWTWLRPRSYLRSFLSRWFKNWKYVGISLGMKYSYEIIFPTYATSNVFNSFFKYSFLPCKDDYSRTLAFHRWKSMIQAIISPFLANPGKIIQISPKCKFFWSWARLENLSKFFSKIPLRGHEADRISGKLILYNLMSTFSVFVNYRGMC